MAGQKLPAAEGETEAQRGEGIHQVPWCKRAEEDKFGFWCSFTLTLHPLQAHTPWKGKHISPYSPPTPG